MFAICLPHSVCRLPPVDDRASRRSAGTTGDARMTKPPIVTALLLVMLELHFVIEGHLALFNGTGGF